MEHYQKLFLLVCDHAFVDQAGKLNLIGIFENINFNEVPNQLLKLVIVGAYLVSETDEKKVKFEINILKPDGSKLLHVENSNALVGENGKLNVIFTLTNVRFDSFGEHIVETIINDLPVGKQTINVKKLAN